MLLYVWKGWKWWRKVRNNAQNCSHIVAIDYINISRWRMSKSMYYKDHYYVRIIIWSAFSKMQMIQQQQRPTYGWWVLREPIFFLKIYAAQWQNLNQILCVMTRTINAHHFPICMLYYSPTARWNVRSATFIMHLVNGNGLGHI